MGLLGISKKNEEVTCVRRSSSSFASTMLCFLHGFNEGDEKTASKDQKNLRFRLLRKSRSTTNFVTTTTSSSMMVPSKSHCRTQSAVTSSSAEVAGASRAVHSLASSTSTASLLQVHRSPSHHLGVFSKMDKASLKLLSTSSPAMTAQSQPAPPPSPKPVKLEKTPTTSKSRQKKFQRHFPSVENDERVLNYYSCALIGDILLQGHLYITKNYFAFYSNVFGYVTKLLIPMLTVEKITKEKTARIIPNAVGISTAEEKHVFGSLMSRDNTYKYMVKVWEISQKAMEELLVESEVLVEPEIIDNAASESDSSETKEVESEKESTATPQIPSTRITNIKIQTDTGNSQRKYKDGESMYIRHKFIQGYRSFFNLPMHTLLLFAATFLLIMLFLSATLLLYRISKIHDKYISLLEDHDLSSAGDDIYSHLLRFSIHLHSKSASSMHNFVDSNLHQIAKVRQDLEVLSSLLMPKDSSNDAKGNRQQDINNS